MGGALLINVVKTLCKSGPASSLNSWMRRSFVDLNSSKREEGENCMVKVGDSFDAASMKWDSRIL